jgi:hypothetical protein
VSLLNTVDPGAHSSSAGDRILLGEEVGFFADLARTRLLQAGAMINTVVTTRPAVALGAALAAGVVVGWLIKRR